MKDKYTVQIRRYKINFEYDFTFKSGEGSREKANSKVRAFLAQHTPPELGIHLQTTPLNIMVRKNGKLISYKSL